MVIDDLLRYNQWNNHVIHSSSRFIRLTKHSATANIGEVVIYSE